MPRLVEDLPVAADESAEMSDPVIGPPHPHILEEELSDELVLYDPEQKTFVALNATAADIWRMATGEFTLDDLVARIAGSYGLEPSEVREQVEAAVGELVAAGLLVSPRP